MRACYLRSDGRAHWRFMECVARWQQIALRVQLIWHTKMSFLSRASHQKRVAAAHNTLLSLYISRIYVYRCYLQWPPQSMPQLVAQL